MEIYAYCHLIFQTLIWVLVTYPIIYLFVIRVKSYVLEL